MPQIDRTLLLDALDKGLGMDDAKELTEALADRDHLTTLSWDNLSGDNKRAKLRELIGWLGRRQALNHLYDWLGRQRPEIARSLGLPVTAPPLPPPTTPAPTSSKPPTPATSAPVTVFFSYAHEDETLRDELAKHLKLLERQKVIDAWHDRRIGAGQEWRGAIADQLDHAQVILLLISADFMASDYCFDVEMKRAIERHLAGSARVIPIILRPYDWFDAAIGPGHAFKLGDLMALPRDARPVTRWSDRDEAFLDIARGIRRVAQELRGTPKTG